MRNPAQQSPRMTDRETSDTAELAWVRAMMLVAVACAALLVLIPAEAAPAASAASPATEASDTAATARYQQDRAKCMNGQSNQDRATCLKEAGAAYVEVKHGGLQVTGSTGGPDALASNATLRCNGLPADESKACLARMQGAGSTSGTAASGGILRELVTVQPAASAASAALK